MTQSFPWKVAWITGASGAICGEIAKRLASAGVTVAATARPSEALTALAAASSKIKPFPADVLKPEEIRETVGRIERELGAIDLALLGAGMYTPFDIRAIDLDGFRRSMALNVDGVVNAVAAVLPPMLARKSGHIAIMGSLFGYAGWPGNGSYGASKAAVINLAESMKLELEGSGVAVTIINPGFVDTPLNASYDPKKKLYVMSKERCARKILERLRPQALRDRLPAAGRVVLEIGALAPARRVLSADPVVHHEDAGLGGSSSRTRGNRYRACDPSDRPLSGERQIAAASRRKPCAPARG